MNEEFSLVDCCVAPILWRLKEVGITLPEKSTKPLQKYMQTMFARDAFRESLTEAELDTLVEKGVTSVDNAEQKGDPT